MKKPPASVMLTAEAEEALISRVHASGLRSDDCQVVERVIRLHFWLMLAIQEAKLSLKRFRQMLFGEPAKGRSEGVAIRIDGNTMLSAIRYELEKLRCSACGAIFIAKPPDGVGSDKYSPRARAALALGRYLLGLPFYRLESYQAMLGVPVSDATQWDQIETLADGVYPVYERLLVLAAQGEGIYQDDTAARLLNVMHGRRQAQDGQTEAEESPEHRGMYTTALVVQVASAALRCTPRVAAMPVRIWPPCCRSATRSLPGPSSCPTHYLPMKLMRRRLSGVTAWRMASTSSGCLKMCSQMNAPG